MLVIVGIFAFVFKGPGPEVDPPTPPPVVVAPEPPVAGGDVAVVVVEVPAGKPVLPFSLLEGALLEGTIIEISEGESAPYRMRDFVDQGFSPGPVTVRVSRPYYKEIVREFNVKLSGPEPEFTADLFVLEPDDELVKLFDDARTAIKGEDFAAASETINRIRRADDKAAKLPEIENLLADRRAAWSKRWTEAFEKARKLIDEGGAGDDVSTGPPQSVDDFDGVAPGPGSDRCGGAGR